MIKKLLLAIINNYYCFTFLCFLFPLKVAKTAAEKKAIYKNRYHILIEQSGLIEESADHEEKILQDIEDIEPHATLYYMGSLNKIFASVRVNETKEGTEKNRIYDKYLIHEIPYLKNYHLGEICRYVSLGHNSLLSFLFHYQFLRKLTETHKVSIFLSTCAPGLLCHYRTITCFPYLDKLYQYKDRCEARIICITGDIHTFADHKVPGLSLLYAFHRKGIFQSCQLKKSDLAQLQEQIIKTRYQINSVPNEIEHIINKHVLSSPSKQFLNLLSPKMIHLLSHHSVIMHCSDGNQILTSGEKDKELFIILNGQVSLKSLQQEKTLSQGDIFGLNCFLNLSKQQTEIITAKGETTLFVIHRNVLKHTSEKDPNEAFHFMNCLVYHYANRF